MADPLTQLLRLVPPPALAVGGPRDWAAAERVVGCALPSDYKTFLDAYGAGELAGFVCVWDPFPNLAGWRATIDAHLAADREARDNCPDEYPGPIFPEPGGRLPWGSTGNGDVLWWRTGGPPDEWTVTAWEARGPGHQEFPVGMAGFLLGWVGGTLAVRVSTDHFIRQAGPVFVPLRPS